MSIKIFTYTNPYDLHNQPYWNTIRKCPTFCAAQTQVNGLINLYEDYQRTTVKTTKYLTEELFDEWENVFTQIKQHAIIDNILNNKIISQLPDSEAENISSAFRFNREEIFKSIRTMFELRMDLANINQSCLSREQKYICEIFDEIKTSNNECFSLKENVSESVINDAIKAALKRNNPETPLPEDLNLRTVVIYGVHQFEPIFLRTIEELAVYKNVIFLFNYQQQYSNVFQTWVDVYSLFEQKIDFFYGTEFQPNEKLTESYKGNMLADHLGRLINGQGTTIAPTQKLEILEFDNITEFAGYVANLYESAVNSGSNVPLAAMREQIYAADSSVNKILKIYYPEQFGEREFLHYPLGHFFLAIANMWDIDSNSIVIRSLSDIRECFSAGIISEENHGDLSTIFDKAISLFEGCSTIGEMLKRLKNIRKYKRYLSYEDQIKAERVSFIKLSSIECDKLGNALNELSQIAGYFFADFEKHPGNFATFYKKLHAYLQEEILDGRELDEAFEGIVVRVLERLNQVQDIDSTASFECLKSTMNIYLQQEHMHGGSAHWIVRDFAQIDGDILRTKKDSGHAIYHFAALSDEDIIQNRTREFPWPLDEDFFVMAQEPVDWKYQVYVRARKEKKNYNRYALIFGLQFNRNDFKLSYVKHIEDREREPYFLLTALGVQKIPYRVKKLRAFTPDVSDIDTLGNETVTFNQRDLERYRICPYRFLLESIIESGTTYKDSFLQARYMEIVLENVSRLELKGLPKSEVLVRQKVSELFDHWIRLFPFINTASGMDIKKKVINRLMAGTEAMFPTIDEEYISRKETFLFLKLENKKRHIKNVLSGKFADETQETINRYLGVIPLQGKKYIRSLDSWCKYCSNHEICMQVEDN